MKKIYKTLLLLLLFLKLPLEAASQEIWGVTKGGGSANLGFIFKMDSSGNNYAVQYEFTSDQNGVSCRYGLIKAFNNKLYGVTQRGGINDVGVLFEFDPATNTFTKKVDFSTSTGAYPLQIVQASNGKIYGITPHGGAADQGVIFEYDPTANSYSKIFDFTISADGLVPGSLIQASNGKLYGTTQTVWTGGGVVYVPGVIFEYDIYSNTYAKKTDFYVSSDNLMQASNGKLYGIGRPLTPSTTFLFEYDIDSNVASYKAPITSYFILSETDGYRTPVMQASNGKLYGISLTSGTNGPGYLFEYDISAETLISKTSLSQPTGV
jgi:uncharacterized repeat protein (TIGR03803 family)